MKKEKQYCSLIEIVAHARLLAALSDEETVASHMNDVKNSTIDFATELGFSESDFITKSVSRYHELIEQIR